VLAKSCATHRTKHRPENVAEHRGSLRDATGILPIAAGGCDEWRNQASLTMPATMYTKAAMILRMLKRYGDQRS
jgi:hypothetical protein